MNRRDRLILRLIMGVAFATFLFAIWALVGWGPARSGTDLPTTNLTNNRPASVK